MSGTQVGKCDRRKSEKSKAFNEKDEEPRFLSSLTPCTRALFQVQRPNIKIARVLQLRM